MKKVIVNKENPNGIKVDLTAEEISAKQTEDTNWETEKTEIANAKTAKANAQASGNQKLLDLGLSQAEATALTGYTPPSEE